VTASLLLGLLLSAVLSGVAYRVWGMQAAVAAAVFGGLALAIQLGAIALVKPVRAAPYQRFVVRWGAGMGLRLLGVAAIALAAGLDPAHFPPLAAAAGFLGVLLPLLILEVRVIR
jgi:hypothetical protein